MLHAYARAYICMHIHLWSVHKLTHERMYIYLPKQHKYTVQSCHQTDPKACCT